MEKDVLTYAAVALLVIVAGVAGKYSHLLHDTITTFISAAF